jgi:uncharacterized membrane protein YdjX (TVP38/TMEM64 family)
MLRADFKTILKIFVLLLILSMAWYLNASGLFKNLMDWVKNLGAFTVPVFILMYALSIVFFVPSIVFTLSAGIIFSMGLGIVYSLMGLGLGSTLALLIGRYMAYRFVQKKFENHRQFQVLSRLVEEKGWKIISLARLSPIFPFLIGNYAFGVTRINPFVYCWSSILGSVPAIFVYVYLGSVTGSLVDIEKNQKGPLEWGLLIVGLILTIVMSFYFKKMADKALSVSSS